MMFTSKLYICRVYSPTLFKAEYLFFLTIVTCHYVGLITSPISCHFGNATDTVSHIHWVQTFKTSLFSAQEIDFNYFFCTFEYDFDMMCVL